MNGYVFVDTFRTGIAASCIGQLDRCEKNSLRVRTENGVKSYIVGRREFRSVCYLTHLHCPGDNCECESIANVLADTSELNMDLAAHIGLIESLEPPFVLIAGHIGSMYFVTCGEDKVIHLKSLSNGLHHFRDGKLEVPSSETANAVITKMADIFETESLGAILEDASSLMDPRGPRNGFCLLQKPRSFFLKKIGFPKKSAPKGYVSGFNFYSKEIREAISEEFPNHSVNEINVVIGDRWHKLPSEEKAKYNDMGEKDKQRYHEEVKKFNEYQIGPRIIPRVNAPNGSHSDEEPIKRGISPYNVFANQERKFVAKLNNARLNSKIGIFIGHRWRNMTDHERDLYISLSNETMEEAEQSSEHV